MIDVEFATGVTTLPEGEVRALCQQAQHLGLPVYVLETAPAANREAFFAAVRSVLPLDPPLISSRSWDALSDSLWEGLEMLDASRIVILWPDAHQMKARASSDFDTAVSVLRDVAGSLHGDPKTGGHRMDICVYLSSAEEMT